MALKTGRGGRRPGSGPKVRTLRFVRGDAVRVQRLTPDGNMAPERGTVEAVERSIFGWSLVLALADGERITIARVPGHD